MQLPPVQVVLTSRASLGRFCGLTSERTHDLYGLRGLASLFQSFLNSTFMSNGLQKPPLGFQLQSCSPFIDARPIEASHMTSLSNPFSMTSLSQGVYIAQDGVNFYKGFPVGNWRRLATSRHLFRVSLSVQSESRGPPTNTYHGCFYFRWRRKGESASRAVLPKPTRGSMAQRR